MLLYYLLLTGVNYLCLNILEYTLHNLSHNINMKYLYNWHHYHHAVEFPLTRLINNNHTYNSIYKNRYLHCSIAICPLLYYLLELRYFLFIMVEITLYLMVVDYFHSSYHKDNSYLEQFKWFKYKKKMHLLHHKQTRFNFNLIDNTTDKLVNTYK